MDPRYNAPATAGMDAAPRQTYGGAEVARPRDDTPALYRVSGLLESECAGLTNTCDRIETVVNKALGGGNTQDKKGPSEVPEGIIGGIDQHLRWLNSLGQRLAVAAARLETLA